MCERISELAVFGALLVSAPAFFARLYSYDWYKGSLLGWVAGLELPQGARLLEVGCGPGNLSMELGAKGFDVTGVDRSKAMIQRAQKLPAQARFHTADALDLPFGNNEFDAVIAGSLFNVVPDGQKLVQEMTRVARPGAQISALFPTPLFSVQASGQYSDVRHLRGMERAAIAVWADKARKIEPETAVGMFQLAGLIHIRVHQHLDGMLAAVVGTKA